MTNVLKLYRCSICGNLISMMEDHGPVPVCCGKNMKLVEENTVDASLEKHIPIVFRNGRDVNISVGSLPHPMDSIHYIEWIIMITDCGSYGRTLRPGNDPSVNFIIDENEKIKGVYAYCNIHGLWANFF